MLEQESVDETDEPVAEPRRRRHPWLRRLIAIVLYLALLAVIAIGGFAFFLNSKVGNVKHEAGMLPTAATGAPETANNGNPIVTSAGENYLVMGSDARAGDSGRADVIILAHVSEKKDKVYLIHFPRDLYVSIPGRGKDKINASYAYGGSALLVRTLQGMLGVKIDHAAKVDFEGFKAMTDAVGGVRVYAEEPSTNGDVVIHKGWNDLNGEQALTFVRERHQLSEGDISRGRRQLAFVKALMVKTISKDVLLNPIRLSQFLEAATSNLVVDEGLTPKLMRSQAFALRGLRPGDIEFITAPFTGFGTAPNGGSIDLVDEPAMEELGIALQNDDVAGYLKSHP